MAASKAQLFLRALLEKEACSVCRLRRGSLLKGKECGRIENWDFQRHTDYI